MKTGNFNKTALQIVTVNDLDGEPVSEFPERNFLREKTFNSELNSLVNKIFNNEKIGETPEEVYNESDSIEKNSLLLKCEKLIYRLKHDEDLNAVTSNYNPFDTDINVYDDIDDTSDYIKAGMLQSGFSKYQILQYNFNDKAYRSDINFLDPSYTSDMYFSVNDPLIQKIKDSDNGFVLTGDLIESDPFFHKKFLNSDSDDLSPRSFYIIKISSLFHDHINNKGIENRITKFEWYLSPLLLIELNSGVETKREDILKSLRDTAALPLMMYFLKNRVKFNINTYSYEEMLLMIELFIKSAVNSKLKSFIITLKDYSIKDNIFIFKFILSKIRRILKGNSMLLRISINRAVLITAVPDISDIYNVIDRVNSEAEMIDMQQIDYNEYLNSKEFVNLFL